MLERYMKVMVFGTFDIVHPGHLDFFRQAKEHGDYLIVQVGRDAVVEKIKGSTPHYTQEERVSMVAELRMVDKVILGHPSDWTVQILEERPDVICLGYDQDSLHIEALLKEKGYDCEIVRLKPFEEHRLKSSLLKDLS